AVIGFSPFEISLDSSGVFPRHGSPRVLWIGVTDPFGKLAALSSRLEEECASEGFPREERPFQPHRTLARLRKSENARTLAAQHKAIHFEPLAIVIRELLVIRSELSSEGSRHTTLSKHTLGL
ncbi:MAG: RNA 2',3'-cyclic phosphodiesterase, partial [Pyrinomonadaceae bacterium]